MNIFKKIWNFIKAFFKNNARQLDKFSEELFAKGIDELVKSLSKTLPKTKKELLIIIERNLVTKFKKIPFIGSEISNLMLEFENKIKNVKLDQITKVFGEFAKQWFNNLYKPEDK